MPMMESTAGGASSKDTTAGQGPRAEDEGPNKQGSVEDEPVGGVGVKGGESVEVV